MTDNPYKPSPEPSPEAKDPQSEDISPEHAAYNIVSDTVVGLNFRLSDNLLQAAVTLGSAGLFAAVGAALAALNPKWDLPWFGGAIIGGFAGLVIGVFGSGVFLMVYRGIRHILGKHD